MNLNNPLFDNNIMKPRWEEKTVKRLIVRGSDIKHNLITSFTALMYDERANTEVVENKHYKLNGALALMASGNYDQLFGEGYTMMMLDEGCFHIVEEFFKEHSEDDERYGLEIHIVKDDGSLIQRVPGESISF